MTLELKRSKRWSILPALSIDGYLDWIIYQGSITNELYIDFVRTRVLPHCFPIDSGRERSVLVMDNASIHYHPELLRIFNEAGVRVEYLPPYSPDFNPIETSFAILKAWIRRHTDLAAAFINSGTFGDFLQLAVRAQDGAYNARNLFRKAGIIHRDSDTVGGLEETDSDESSSD